MPPPRYVPLLNACAADPSAPVSVRSAAASALGRVAHLHAALAQSLLPSLLPLCARGQPELLRTAATLVLVSLVPLTPRLVEPHLEALLLYCTLLLSLLL